MRSLYAILSLMVPIVTWLMPVILPGSLASKPAASFEYVVVTEGPSPDVDGLATRCQYETTYEKCSTQKTASSIPADPAAPDWLKTRCQYETTYAKCSTQKAVPAIAMDQTPPDWLKTRCQYETTYAGCRQTKSGH